MSKVKLGYTAHSNRSTPRDRVLGSWLKKIIAGEVFAPNSAAAFLQRSFLLPFSERTFTALPWEAKAYAQPELYLKFREAPKCRAVIPNLWQQHQHQPSIRAFLALPRSFRTPARAIFGNALEAFPPLSLREVFQAWEAVALAESDPLTVSYLGGRFTFALPERTDLVTDVIPKSHRRRKQHHNAEEGLREYSHIYEVGRGEKDPDFRKALLEEFESQRSAILKTLSPSSQAALTEIDRLRDQNPSYALTSLGRQSRAFVAAASIIQKGNFQIEVRSPEYFALGALADFLPPDAKIRRRSEPRRMVATRPELTFVNYGLDKPPPETASLADMALRIAWVILIHCGRRASCLLQVTLGDFHEATDLLHNRPWLDLRVASIKSKEKDGIRLPLSLLLPETELHHIREFLVRARMAFSHNWREMTLVEVIGGENIDPAYVDKCGPLLRSLLAEDAVQAVHLPRYTYATWLPLRILCARDPELLSRRAMDPLRDEIWFSREMLLKMAELVGTEATDALELARRILGHSTSYEFIASYCRGWSYALRVVANL